MVGSAIYQNLKQKGFDNLIGRSSSELDLKNQSKVSEFFLQEKPDYVFLAAAKVGGIHANDKYKANFIYDNLAIQNNIIHQSYKAGVKKLLFLGSSCIYPKVAPQPIKEDYLLTGPLEQTNEPYAIAKIAGIKMCQSYNYQYGTNFISVMPTNLYGRNDNYNLETSHVLPAIIRKLFLGKCIEDNNWVAIRKDLEQNTIGKVSFSSSAKDIQAILNTFGIEFDEFVGESSFSQNKKRIELKNLGHQNKLKINGTRKVKIKLWGSGSPLREFLHADDLADACVFLMENYNLKNNLKNGKIVKSDRNNIQSYINIGSGEEISIKDLAKMIKIAIGFRGDIIFDKQMPDGTYRKFLDSTFLNNLGWCPKISLKSGIDQIVKHSFSQKHKQ